jgi:glutathione-specific gamma-glutamylcyclotransferase
MIMAGSSALPCPGANAVGPLRMKLTPELVARAHRDVRDVALPEYLVPRTEADHEEDVATLLGSHPVGEDFWLFAYGSLLWNPGVTHVEEKLAVVRGWHRAFCMRIRAHRGTPDRPGLMMALDRGGQCRGLLLRLPHENLEDELRRLVRREMPVKRIDGIAVQSSRWVEARTESGSLRALTYVINRHGSSYAGALDQFETADILAGACGTGGSCAEYLYNTVIQLDARGIRDRNLWRLQSLVAERLADVAPQQGAAELMLDARL